MRPKAPTLRDVARLAGVSSATVSRALERPAMVGEATRQRVLAAVERSRYVPNAQARKLRRQQADAVILLVRDIANPFYLDIFRGVEAVASAAGLDLLMGNASDDVARIRHHFRMVRERHADGLVLMTGKLPEADAMAGVPVVAALEYFPGLALPTVRIDNAGAGAQAVRHLIGLGHRRVAHVTGPLAGVMSVERMAGWRRGMRAAGLPAGDELVARGDFTIPSGHRAVAALFARRPYPTAVFCSSDTMAFGVVNELRARGLEVPRDVSVVGFDDLVLAGDFHPSITTIRQPCFEIGRTAMRLLVDLIGGQPAPRRHVVMPTELVVRGSTAAPRRS